MFAPHACKLAGDDIKRSQSTGTNGSRQRPPPLPRPSFSPPAFSQPGAPGFTTALHHRHAGWLAPRHRPRRDRSLVRPEDIAAVGAARAKHFVDARQGSATIIVKALVRPEWLIES